MTARQTSSKRKQPASSSILLRYRAADSDYGVSRKTAARLAQTLGLNETQVIHVALAKFARQTLPQYEPDNGPLTEKQMRKMERLHPRGRMRVTQRLF